MSEPFLSDKRKGGAFCLSCVKESARKACSSGKSHTKHKGVKNMDEICLIKLYKHI